MNYYEIRPCQALAAYVNCFWYFESDSHTEYHDCSFPDGCLEIIFNIGTEVYRSADNKLFTQNPPVELIGQMTAPYFVRFKGMNRILGVRFFPHTFSRFTHMLLHELNDHTLDADQVLGKAFRKVADLILQEENISRSIAVIEQFLINKLQTVLPDPKFHMLAFSVNEILWHTSNTSYNLQNLLIPIHHPKNQVQRLPLYQLTACCYISFSIGCTTYTVVQINSSFQ